MGENQSYVLVLIETLQKKKDILDKILSITLEQETISKASVYDEEAMEKTLNQKEFQITRLNELDDGFQSVYGRVRIEIRENMDQYKEEIKKMQDLIRQCTDLGNAIQVLEQRNRDRFAQIFRSKHGEYKMSKAKTAVASNYLKTMNNTKIMDAYFVDKKK